MTTRTVALARQRRIRGAGGQRHHHPPRLREPGQVLAHRLRRSGEPATSQGDNVARPPATWADPWYAEVAGEVAGPLVTKRKWKKEEEQSSSERSKNDLSSSARARQQTLTRDDDEKILLEVPLADPATRRWMITYGSCDNGRQMLADFKALYGAPIGNNERFVGIGTHGCPRGARGSKNDAQPHDSPTLAAVDLARPVEPRPHHAVPQPPRSHRRRQTHHPRRAHPALEVDPVITILTRLPRPAPLQLR